MYTEHLYPAESIGGLSDPRKAITETSKQDLTRRGSEAPNVLRHDACGGNDEQIRILN